MNLRWTRPLSMPRTNLLINFPNQSRSFDQAHGCVSFWGYAATIEVNFQVDGDVLRMMSPGTADDEASLLEVFDSRREAIEAAARTQYGRNRLTFCRLTRADF